MTPFSQPYRGRRLLALATLIVLSAWGCGPSVGSISGTVKYHGAPLPSGTISFLSQAGEKQVVASDIVDGKYTIKAIQPGPAQVIVATIPPSKGGTPPGGGKGIEAPNPGPAPGKYVPIPAKYSNPEQSGLTYEIKSGSQTKDFDLTP